MFLKTDTAYLKEMKVEFWAYIENISGLIHEHSESDNAMVHFTYSIGFKHFYICNKYKYIPPIQLSLIDTVRKHVVPMSQSRFNEKDLPGKDDLKDYDINQTLTWYKHVINDDLWPTP